MDKEIEKVEQIEETKTKSDEKEVKRNYKSFIFTKSKIIKYSIFLIIMIYSIIMNIIFKDIKVVLGDFGSIIPLLLHFLKYVSFKWLPIFSIAGILFTVFEEKFKDMCKAFLIISIIMVVGTTIVSFIV